MKKYREDEVQAIRQMYIDEINRLEDMISSILHEKLCLEKRLAAFEDVGKILGNITDYHIELSKAEIKRSLQDESVKICIPVYFYSRHKNIEEAMKWMGMGENPSKGDEHGQS